MTPFVWAPSGQRVLSLFDAAAMAPRGRLATWLPLRWADKPVAATLDYGLDAGAALAGDSDTLTVSASIVGGVVASAVIVQTGIVTLLLTGGTAGLDSLIGLTLSFTSGRRIHRTIRLRVV